MLSPSYLDPPPPAVSPLTVLLSPFLNQPLPVRTEQTNQHKQCPINLSTRQAGEKETAERRAAGGEEDREQRGGDEEEEEGDHAKATTTMASEGAASTAANGAGGLRAGGRAGGDLAAAAIGGSGGGFPGGTLVWPSWLLWWLFRWVRALCCGYLPFNKKTCWFIRLGW